MIVFDLKCGGGHVFEAWFGSTPAYEEQRAAGRVRCPLCDSGDITKALMAPAIASKGNRKLDAPTPGAIKAVMQRLASQQAEAQNVRMGRHGVRRTRSCNASGRRETGDDPRAGKRH